MASTTLAVPGRKVRPVKGPNMEGFIARNYAKLTAPNGPGFEAEARALAAGLAPGAQVLEIAPGPGYLAIALAKMGNFHVLGIDYSHTFVQIANDNAKAAGVAADFRQGNASELPVASDRFDLIVCRAAFKNFGDPLGALCEMHRVLRPGGTAIINDMDKGATNAAIAQEVSHMNLGWFGAMFTRFTLRDLRRRAYTRAQFEQMIAQTPFGRAEITSGGIGFDIRLRK